MDTPLLCPVSAWAVEVMKLQTQKSIAKLPQALVDTGIVDLFPVFPSLFYSVIQSSYFMFSLHSFVSHFLSSTSRACLPDFLFSSFFNITL